MAIDKWSLWMVKSGFTMIYLLKMVIFHITRGYHRWTFHLLGEIPLQSPVRFTNIRWLELVSYDNLQMTQSIQFIIIYPHFPRFGEIMWNPHWLLRSCSINPRAPEPWWKPQTLVYEAPPTRHLATLGYIWCSKNPSFRSWLVVYLPLWKIWKSMGRMTSHIWWKIKHVPNHQPV